ncbi:uncharacterized protein LOC141695425 [Apium graveolens]|uniref:uncharacterized protein LOC141695425 n=1 Tax=Apium graveolens TaxID=4045 RepID=UPI003D78C870
MPVDNGSLVNILYYHAFAHMDTGDRKLKNSCIPRYGFTGNEVHVVGTIDMPILFGPPLCQIWKVVKFHVVSASFSFNLILGRTTITALRAITSITHLKMKFFIEFGVGEVIEDQAAARQCYLTTVSPRAQQSNKIEFNQVLDIDPREMINIPVSNSCSIVEETEEIEVIEGIPYKTTRLGKNLTDHLKLEITSLICEFTDIFSWDPKDMSGIPEAVTQYSLYISKNITPIRQKRSIFSKEKKSAIDQELDRLLAAGFIALIKFPTWISNIVLVKKVTANGKCASTILTSIGHVQKTYILCRTSINSSTPHREMNSYHSWMPSRGTIRKKWIIKIGNNWLSSRIEVSLGGYRVIPFSLINIDATFQQIMDTIFGAQIGRNMLY